MSKTKVDTDFVIRQLVDNLEDLVWVAPIDSSVPLYVNRAFEKLFGMSEEEASAEPYAYMKRIHPDDRQRADEAIKKRALTGENSDIEFRVVRPDGSVRILFARTFLVAGSDGKIEYTFGHTQDITERRLFEENLRQSEERFRSAFENAAIGMAIVGTDGRILKVNNSLCRILGRAEEALLATDFQSITHPDDLDADLEYVRRMLSGEIRTYSMEKRYFHSLGHTVWALLTVSLVYDPEGKPLYFISQVHDLTDLKKAHEISERTRLMEQREDFVATLTHDLKNPLLGANRLVEMLEAGNLGPVTKEQSDAFTRLKKSNLSLLYLIQNLLDVYRLEKDVSTVEFELFDMMQLIKSCIDEFAPLANSQGVGLHAELPEHQVNIEAESDLIRHVVQNLLDNALKFTPQGGEINLSLSQLADTAVMEIKDNGPGMSGPEQERLYQRFRRGHGAKKYTAGSGLGLYLCKKIVDAHKGEIYCRTKLGAGSTFTVKLPLSQSRRRP